MDLVGQKYNHWTVIQFGGFTPDKKKLWLCRCVCGVEKKVREYALITERSKSCGCRNGKDLTGQRFGNLVALKPVIRGDRIRVWLCQCDCGEKPTIRAQSLINGSTKSCGCAGAEKRRKALKEMDAVSIAYGQYKAKAKKLKTHFFLSKNEFSFLWSLSCQYCYAPQAHGIDRVDEAFPYVVTNVVPCCPICNNAKGSMPVLEFQAWIDRLVEHRTSLRHLMGETTISGK